MQEKTNKISNKLQPKVVFVQPLRQNYEIPLALTYDDVLLRPRKSRVKSRGDVLVSTRLTKKITLNMPIVSANMDAVTESSMAIALARMGGIGIVHRFMPIEKQVEEIRFVKSPEQHISRDLLTISPSQTLAAAWRLMDRNDVSSLLVVNSDGTLSGIVTSRDIIFENDPKKRINELMTGRDHLITASPDTTLLKAKEILAENKIEKLPLVDKKGVLKGLITAKDIIKEREFPRASRDNKGRLMVGAAIGVRGDYLERAERLVEAGADVLVLDIAHGHSEHAIAAVVEIKKKLDCELVAGNVATAEGVRDLVRAGADAIKVGVGPGSACTTRVVAGVGVPQLSAVLECAEEADKQNVPIIADGGIRTSGDIVKALAAGASTVMAGNLLGGTDESPGEVIEHGGKKFKAYRGMASGGAATDRKLLDGILTDGEWFNHQVVPEGIEATVPYKGSVIDILYQLTGGLRSGMSYLNAMNLDELKTNAQFVRITNAGLSESKPHDLHING